MKILFQSREDLFDGLGGDTIQILKTKKELEKLGYQIDINCSIDKDLSEYDLVHIFNLQTIKTTARQIANAKRQQKKIVLSTIWWDFRNFGLDNDIIMFSSRKRKLTSMLLMPFSNFNRNKAYCLLDRIIFDTRTKKAGRDILNSVDAILPNSIAELEILVQNFNMPELRAKADIVVNAVDINDQYDYSLTKLNDLPPRYVLCVGRIEPIKGQAKVIRALYTEKHIPLVFIGKGIDSLYGRYVKKIAEQRTNVYFIPTVKHELLGQYYRNAKVHVLPSLRESPGLVSLEAALYDTNIVVSYQAPIQEYFRDNAFVCNPEDISSIRKSILDAYMAPVSGALKKHILQNLTWGITAEQTSAAYRRVMSKCI